MLVTEATDALWSVSWPEANSRECSEDLEQPKRRMSQGRKNSEVQRQQSHLGQGGRGVRKNLLSSCEMDTVIQLGTRKLPPCLSLIAWGFLRLS